MMTTEKQEEEKIKILEGLKKSYAKLIDFKKARNSPLVVMRNNKIIKIVPK